MGPIVWIRRIRSDKFRSDFVARTFALIAPVYPILHRVSYSYETIPNAFQHFVTHQNMSLWSNVVDQMRSLQKLQRDFVARSFVLIEQV